MDSYHNEDQEEDGKITLKYFSIYNMRSKTL
jgi:hypothetical protein